MLRIIASEPAEETALKVDLDALVREGARRMLVAALKAEVDEYIAQHGDDRDEAGHALVVRNGRGEPRKVTTAAGELEIQAPRVDDRREGRRFTSAILPPWARRSPKVTEVLPVLYLRGISTKDFEPALAEFFGSEAGLSASTIQRLTREWTQEWATFQQRDLSHVDYVYLWADGVHFNIRLEEGRQCILVLMGATAEGKMELIAIADGYRESEQSWKELLLDCKARGLEIEPSLAIGDGALGFWKAMRQVWDTTREQRCWVHKTANVLDKLPKGSQPKAKRMLHDIYQAETRAQAEKAFDLFVTTYEAKYPQAVECLVKDRGVLLSFYDFPAEHWRHIRTTNPIESTFATVRLRTVKTKGCGSRVACLTMVSKLRESASRSWRSLNGSARLRAVTSGVKFVDGIEVKDAA